MPEGKASYVSQYEAQKDRPKKKKKLKDAGVLTPAQKKLPKDLQDKIIKSKQGGK